jgi:hypothetical protein
MVVWDDNKKEYVELGDSLARYPGSEPKTLSAPFADSGQQSAYVEKLKAMSAPKAQPMEEAQAEPTPGKEAASGDGGAAGAKAVAESMKSGTDEAGAAGSGLMAIGGATANPYLVGAGLGLTAMSQISAGKNKRAAQEYESEIQKYNQRQAAIARMAQIGSGLKA